MEAVVEREHMARAYRRVVRNGGAPGVDQMPVELLLPYLKEHWVGIKEDLLAGRYQPQPVRIVEIPKPSGGVRMLGIPMFRSYCTSYNRVGDFRGATGPALPNRLAQLRDSLRRELDPSRSVRRCLDTI